MATIEIGTRYIKLNAAYNHQLALKTNKHFEEASGLKVCVASKKYTIYVFLLVAKLKNISPSESMMSHGKFHVQFLAKYQFT